MAWISRSPFSVASPVPFSWVSFKMAWIQSWCCFSRKAGSTPGLACGRLAFWGFTSASNPESPPPARQWNGRWPLRTAAHPFSSQGDSSANKPGYGAVVPPATPTVPFANSILEPPPLWLQSADAAIFGTRRWRSWHPLSRTAADRYHG